MSDAAPAAAPVDAPADAPEAPPTTPTDTATPAAAKPPEPPKPEPRKYKVKIDGQESEVTDEELVRGYQRASAASKRLEEVAKARKELEERTAKLKADPWAFLKETAGLDPDQLAIQRVQRLMEQEAMTEEQRRIAQLQAEKEAAEARAKAFEEQQRTAAQQQAMQKAADELNRAIPAAAERAGLPRSPVVGRLMLEHMLSTARAGVEPNPDDAAEYAAETIRSWQQGAVSSMDDAKLAQFLGPDVVKRLAAYAANQARSTLPGAATPKPGAPPAAPKQTRPPVLSIEEWRERYG